MCVMCSEEKRFIVTAAADPARLHPILYAYICVTRIGVYIMIPRYSSKYDGGDEFSGKNIREKMNEATILLLYTNNHSIRCIILYNDVHNGFENISYRTRISII